jgi:spore germination cell wall hydrolase CwlJ-like protein
MPIVFALGMILVALVATMLAHERPPTTVVEPAPAVQIPNRMQVFWYPLKMDTPVKEFSAREIECLAKNIFFEAGVESDLGKYAVAQVTINRLRTGHWGNDLCKVIYASHQFSWTKDNRKRNARPGRAPLKGPNWDHSLEIARDVAEGRYMSTLTTALWYHADYVRPNWRDPNGQIKQIGRHIFYHRVRGSNITVDGSGVL